MVHTQGVPKLMEDEVVHTITPELRLDVRTTARHLNGHVSNKSTLRNGMSNGASTGVVPIDHHRLAGVTLNQFTREL